MFEIEDFIVHSSAGVCRVENITTPKETPSLQSDNQDQPYYTLKPLSKNDIIYTPANNSKVLMRPVINAAQANELIDRMSHTKPKAFHTRNLQELRNHYKTAFKSLSCEDLMSLAMSIYAKKQELEENNRKLGQVDEQYMRQAEERLHEEFSIALSIPKEEVPIYIDKRMEKIAR